MMNVLTLLLPLLAWCLFPVIAQATNFYVTVDGNDGNSGTTLATSWKTLAFAASSPLVAPGDTVYVQAGQYSGEVIFSRGGTSENPVTFAGFQSNPGDNPSINYQLNDPLQPQIMPLFNGNNRAAGTAFDIRAPYITIRNFQITNYAQGVQAWGQDKHHIILENIIALTLGELGGENGYIYSGKGITLTYSSSNHIKNCVIVNANAEGITLVGNNNLIEDSRVYSNEVNQQLGADGTDYYIVIAGNFNTVRRCTIERIVPEGSYTDPSYPHVGHGLGFKDAAENNLVEDCVAKNLEGGGFYVRWVNARNNIFRRCTAYGATGFLCRNGAENNLFDSCTAQGCRVAVRFFRSSPEGAEDNADYAAKNNLFVNCLFLDTSAAVIDFNPYSTTRPDDAVLNNSFVNCTISNAPFLVSSNRPNQGHQMINCILSGVQGLKDPTSTVALDFSFANSCFFNGFPAPQGEGNISNDPLFALSGKDPLQLRPGSACIDSGQATVAEAEHDKNGISRPTGFGWDMGAYEYKQPSFLLLNLPAMLHPQE